MLIWKYILPLPKTKEMISILNVPRTSHILSALEQNGEIIVYVRFKQEYQNDLINKEILILPTGFDYNSSGIDPIFINTVKMENGNLMFHLFEVERIGRI